MPINESTIDIAAGERLQEAAEIERLRKLTDCERGEEILAVCRAAAAVLEGRRKSGLPPPIRQAWPASTWEYLRKCAANGKRD